jgi:hypothetical protein
MDVFRDEASLDHKARIFTTLLNRAHMSEFLNDACKHTQIPNQRGQARLPYLEIMRLATLPTDLKAFPADRMTSRS